MLLEKQDSAVTGSVEEVALEEVAGEADSLVAEAEAVAEVVAWI